MALSARRDGAPETVESLGGGWIAEEALSIAIYACLCARGFEHGLTMAVTHSGDSDSTGAIAGNALGLMFPDQVRSHRWARHVECADLIAQISNDLALSLSGQAEELGDVYLGF
jgi:ADP-ribosylglycohydrolase